MPNVEDNMDELFKKASENYPLRTTGSFDDLLPYLAGPSAVTGTGTTLKGKGKKRILLLTALLLGLSAATYFIYTQKNNSEKTAVDKQAPVKAEVPDNSITKNNDAEKKSLTSTENKNTPKNAQIFYPANKIKDNSKFSAKIISGNMLTDDEGNDEYISGISKDEYKTAAQTKVFITIPSLTEDLQKKSLPEIAVEKKYETKKNKNESPVTDIKGDKNKLKRPSFYYGIHAGAELNQVKQQAMTRVSFTGGIFAGLQINKKLSAEVGIQFSQKKYYSEGKYFNPKAGTMPANMKVNSLTSSSTLIEIPISVKYNFSKKKNSFYGKAGISTYLMTKENNNYNAVVSGQQQNINSTYTNTHCYTAATVNIGAGYQFGITKKLKIGIEPYLQIPLKGIGIGYMPVTSTGIQLVLTHK